MELTASKSQGDVLRNCDINAICYVTGAADPDQKVKAAKIAEDFWITKVKLQRK